MLDAQRSSFKWTAESISSFWDEVAGDEDLSQIYFTKYNSSFIEFLARIICEIQPGETSILDYGCGAGFLSELFIKKGYETTSLDFSISSCIKTEERLKGLNYQIIHANRLPTPLSQNSFDLVCSVETVEHLLDEWVESYFEELFRLVRPAGHVLITAPFSEHLGLTKCICPNCKTKFHRWGHLRSLNINDLMHYAQKAGFQTVFAKNVEITSLNKRFLSDKRRCFDYSISELFNSLKNRVLLRTAGVTSLSGLKRLIRFKEGANLIYIGKKI